MTTVLAEAGSDVATTSRSLENTHKSAKAIAADMGRKVARFSCDVRFEDQVESMVDSVLAAFGRIDILVNNAGNVVSTPANKPLEQRPLKEWEFTVDTNMKGVFLCSNHVVAKAMKPAMQGVIINIGSVTHVAGVDHRVYGGTDMGGVTIDHAPGKGGVINMTRETPCWLAQYNIRVSCISPGSTAIWYQWAVWDGTART